MTVFQSTYLPLEALIYMVHLDDKRYAHHNVGYPDKNKKEGIVCNGRSWRTEEMNKIMHELRSSKSKDLAKLWSEVRRYLSSETIQEIKKRIERCNQICYDPKEWKSFAEHIKLEFYNKRHLALKAKKTMKTYSTDNGKFDRNKYECKFRDGLDLKTMIELHNQYIAEEQHQVAFQKDMLDEILNIYKTKGLLT